MIDPGQDDPLELLAGVDTDLDGGPDTVSLPDPVDLAFAVDTDHDGLVDLLLRIGPGGGVTSECVDPDEPWLLDDHGHHGPID